MTGWGGDEFEVDLHRRTTSAGQAHVERARSVPARRGGDTLPRRLMGLIAAAVLVVIFLVVIA